MVAVGVVLAAIGPYGSFAMGGYATRLAYWLPAALGGYAIVRPTVLLTGAAAKRLSFPAPAGLGAGVLLAAVPLSFFILWLNGRSWDRLPSFAGWLHLYLQVALIGGGVTLLFYLLERPRTALPFAAPEAAAPPLTVTPPETVAPPEKEAVPSPARPFAPLAPPFLSRLPPHLRDRLVPLQMEDHYVRAHAADASALILLRMGDAVSELAAVDGMRVHRSWWVARNAVERVTPDGRSVRLTLRGGIEAPVARSRLPALRAAGWLD